MKVIESTLYSVLRPRKNTEYEDIDTLRVLASFIHASVTYEVSPVGANNILEHWNHISHLCDMYTGDELHEKIRSGLTPITGALEISMTSPSDISAELLNIHGRQSYIVLSGILEAKRVSGNKEEVAQISLTIDTFCKLTSTLLQRFPDTEKQVAEWIATIDFETPPAKTSCAMSPLVQ